MSHSDYHSSFQNDQSQQWAGENVYTEERCSQKLFIFLQTHSLSHSYSWYLGIKRGIQTLCCESPTVALWSTDPNVGPQTQMKIHKAVSSPSSLRAYLQWKFTNGIIRFQHVLEELMCGFSCGSPQDVYWREIPLGIPGERWGWRLVEMAHEEDPNRANKEHRRHDDKTDPVDHPANQEPFFILLG